MLDAASRSVDPKPRSVEEVPSSASAVSDYDFSRPMDHYASSGPREFDETRRLETHSVADSPEGDESNGIPDPFDRIESVARVSLAGSIKLVSAAMRGVGDAVFQAGAVAEGLAGGTGQLAGEGGRGSRQYAGGGA